MGKTKVCTKCGSALPATFEYFYKRTKSKDGLSFKCISCFKKYRDEHYLKDKGKILDNNKKYQNGHKEEIKKYLRQYYQDNKNKIIKNVQERYESDKEEILNYHKGYQEKNREKVSIYQGIYREKNHYKLAEYKNKYRINNKDKINSWLHEYYKTERCKSLASTSRQKRRSLKRKLESSFTNSQWESCKKYFNNTCAYCGKETSLTQDHFVPLSKQGEYTKNNIVPACKSCNSKKLNKNFFGWYRNQLFYNKQRELKILKYLNYDSETKIQQLALF